MIGNIISRCTNHINGKTIIANRKRKAIVAQISNNSADFLISRIIRNFANLLLGMIPYILGQNFPIYGHS